MNRKPRPSKPAPRAAYKPPLSVPLAPRRVWRLLIGGFSALALTAAAVWAMAARLPEQAVLGAANAATRAGLTVRHVAISGTRHQPKLSIYREVLSGSSDSMLLTDIASIRTRLKALPWVRDASIIRRWPDALEIRIVEREPAALWQHRGTIRLIDAEGTVLPAERLEDFSALPLLVGRTARDEAGSFLKLIASAPRIEQQMEAAIRVGERRWDLKMASGETLSLPEGPAEAAALKRFAEIDRKTPLLGQGFVRFDMRIPEKMVVRVSSEAGARAKPKAPSPKLAQPPTLQATPNTAPQPALPDTREVVI
jgi:cell division protein FtsQ